eukprot:gb/GFBE01067257.1/.p1 GENE.gb/GFBE01067257.1/~~gb/GFBE01067257.1/.p1  ORF type:complete len:763 (+),score=149.68 gb/GFBE01067257.1/:1-2289(+)
MEDVEDVQDFADAPRQHPFGDSKDGFPLRVIPKGAVYTVPQVFGLDEYCYEVGSRLAQRSEARVMQDILRESPASAFPKRPSSAALTPTTSTRGCKELLVQPGTSGSALMIWNSSKATTDSNGAAQVRKRRQKVTDNLLREIVCNHGDPLSLVSWWFRIFEHYADPPPQVMLPSLPDRRDREEDELPEPPLSEGSSPASGRRASSLVSGFACGRPSFKPPAGAIARSLPRPQSAPRLRELADIHKVTKRRCDDQKCEHRRVELKKDRALLREAGLAGDKAGNLDLYRRFRLETLDAEKFDNWISGFECVQDQERRRDRHVHSAVAELQQLSKRKSAPARGQERRRTFHRTSLRDVTGRYMHKLNQKVESNSLFEREFSSSATSSEDEQAQEENSQDELPEAICDISATEVMLRSSSLALLNSNIIRKSRDRAQEKNKPSYDEVARRRALILRSVVPVEMTVTNLASLMMRFGIQRPKTVERIAGYLLLGVPHNARRKSKARDQLLEEQELGQQQSKDEVVPFEVFYSLMRALQAEHEPLAESEILRRVMFCALTGQTGVSFTMGSAARLDADTTLRPISYESLMDALGLMLSPQLLHEVDTLTRLRDATGHLPADSCDLLTSAAATGGAHLDVQMQGLAEFLLLEICHVEAAKSSGGSAPGEGCQCQATFHCFQRFVSRWPGVYMGLLFTLMPLALHGARYAAEEMDLAQKGLAHRAGEIRAKVEAQTLQGQRRQMEKLFVNFVQPWKEAMIHRRKGSGARC